MSHVSLIVVAGLALWSGVELAAFSALVKRSSAMEPCPTDIERGVHVQVFTNFTYWWGSPFYGVESGSFHAYAGPGGAFWRVGIGNVVLEATHPMCS
mgnify:FL=1